MIEIKETENDSFKFYVKTEDNAVLLTSVPFGSVEEVEKILVGLDLSGRQDLKFERKTNHEGKFLFRVKNAQGGLLGVSQPYNSEAGMENGIKNLKIRWASLSRDRSVQS